MKKETKEAIAPLTLIVLFGVAIYAFVITARYITTQPHLFLSVPKNEVTTKDTYDLKGTAAPKAVITVLGRKTTADKKGDFLIVVPLYLGINKLRVATGKITKEVAITRKQPKSAATTKQTTPTKQIVTTRTANSTESGLATSGPAENIMGSFGLASIIISLALYRKSKNKVNSAQILFT